MVEQQIKLRIQQEEQRAKAIRDRNEKIQRIMQKMENLVPGDREK